MLKTLYSFLIVFLLFSFLASISLFVVPVHALTEYENYTVGTASGVFYTTNWVATCFLVGETGHTVTEIHLYLNKTGSPIGNITASIQGATSTGLPNGSELTTSTPINASTLGSGDWVIFTVPEYTLSASTNYTVVVRDSADSSSNCPRLFCIQTGSKYRSYSSNSGSSWTLNAGGQYNFQIWGNALAISLSFSGLIPISFSLSHLNTWAFSESSQVALSFSIDGLMNYTISTISLTLFGIIPITFQLESVRTYLFNRYVTISFHFPFMNTITFPATPLTIDTAVAIGVLALVLAICGISMVFLRKRRN